MRGMKDGGKGYNSFSGSVKITISLLAISLLTAELDFRSSTSLQSPFEISARRRPISR